MRPYQKVYQNSVYDVFLANVCSLICGFWMKSGWKLHWIVLSHISYWYFFKYIQWSLIISDSITEYVYRELRGRLNCNCFISHVCLEFSGLESRIIIIWSVVCYIFQKILKTICKPASKIIFCDDFHVISPSLYVLPMDNQNRG